MRRMRLVDAEVVRAAYGIPRGTLYRWRCEDRIVKHDDGRHALYDLDEIDQLVQMFAR